MIGDLIYAQAGFSTDITDIDAKNLAAAAAVQGGESWVTGAAAAAAAAEAGAEMADATAARGGSVDSEEGAEPSSAAIASSFEILGSALVLAPPSPPSLAPFPF